MILLWFLAGCVVEVLNTFLRKWSVSTLDPQKPGHVLGGIVGGFLVRLVGTSLVLWLAFRHSAMSGLAALLGYWICRWLMIWWISRHPL